ncbi:MAG: glucose-1-phosphate cytidylyltransferase [Desulfamplus sp.]
MKVLILAGGLGTRIYEESEIRPKPMVEIGGKPILWHIMKIYSHYGFNEFGILLGYKGHLIKEYFAHYYLYQSDVTFDLSNNTMSILNNSAEPWKVTLLDTGTESMTGGRIKRAQWFIGDEPFMLTYGDGVGDIDISKLVLFHKSHGKALTMTSVQPEGRFGAMDIQNDSRVSHFMEKPKGDSGWVNAGFFVCQPKVFDYIKEGDQTVFEGNPIEQLTLDGELFAYKHNGFWKCMDTMRDKNQLNEMWKNNQAKWKIWQ